MPPSLDKLDPAFAGHIKSVALAYSALEGEEGKVLCQFTDAQGLLGIVQKRALHATSHRFVNDRSEGEYGFAMFRGIASELHLAAPK